MKHSGLERTFMHDVFISYKSQDSAVAMRVVNTLEASGIPCWIAERNISAGSNYAADIPAAIDQCKVLVLIFTSSAQGSPWIMKELDSAIAGHKLILPVKIGHFEISGAMSFLLTGVQYFDATMNPEDTMTQLVYRIRQAIANNEGGDHKKTKKIKVRRSNGCLVVLLTMAACLALVHYAGVIDVISYIKELPTYLSQFQAYLIDLFAQLVISLSEKLS